MSERRKGQAGKQAQTNRQTEIGGGGMKVYCEEFYNLYSSLNIRIIKSRRVSGQNMEHAWEKLEMRTKFYTNKIENVHGNVL